MRYFKKRKSEHVKKLLSAADQERDAGNAAAAAHLYKIAIESFGEDFGIFVQLGNCLKDSEQFVPAQAAYENALKLRPGDPDCHLQLGHLYKLMGQKEIALDYYQRSVDLQSENNPALHEFEWLSEELQRIQREDQIVKLNDRGSHDKINIFFGNSRDAHGWMLSLDAMRFYKKISIHNSWRR